MSSSVTRPVNAFETMERTLLPFEASASNGRLLFADKHCVVCHALVQRGDEEAPDLVEGQRQRSQTEFAAAMWNKAPGMLQAMEARGITQPTLRPDEMADIVAYLYSVRYFRFSGRPHEGVLVAVNKGCLDCHGLYGERGKSASDLDRAGDVDAPAGALSALWNHSFVDDPRPERERRPWPTMRADEMANLMAYLRSIAHGRTMIVIDHDMAALFELVERVMVLNEGRVLTEGTPEQIKRNPTVQEAYLGGMITA